MNDSSFFLDKKATDLKDDYYTAYKSMMDVINDAIQKHGYRNIKPDEFYNKFDRYSPIRLFYINNYTNSSKIQLLLTHLVEFMIYPTDVTKNKIEPCSLEIFVRMINSIQQDLKLDQYEEESDDGDSFHCEGDCECCECPRSNRNLYEWFLYYYCASSKGKSEFYHPVVFNSEIDFDEKTYFK